MGTVSGREDENVKSLQTDGQTDRLTNGHTIRKAHFRFHLKRSENVDQNKTFIRILPFIMPTLCLAITSSQEEQVPTQMKYSLMEECGS